MSMPVFMLKRVMPYKEFLQWASYYSVERANYNQTDVNIAHLVVLGSKGKIKIKDILPSRKSKKQSKSEIMTGFKMLSNAIRSNKERG